MKSNTKLATLLFLGALPLASIAADTTTPQGGSPMGTSPAGSSTATTRQDDASAPMFKELDTNKDGYVSRDEAKRSAEVTSRFSEIDADHDGRITTSEFRKGMQPKM